MPELGVRAAPRLFESIELLYKVWYGHLLASRAQCQEPKQGPGGGSLRRKRHPLLVSKLLAFRREVWA